MDYIDERGIVSFAEYIPGIPDKVYSQVNSGALGMANHSVVGEESEFQDGVPNRFLSTEKGADGRYTAAAAASVIWVLRKSGHLIQMYSCAPGKAAATWTSGGPEGNTRYLAMELEGGGYWPNGTPNFSEPMTMAQQATYIRLYTLLEREYGWPRGQERLFNTEHRFIAARFGYDATACASGRYTLAVDRLAAGERYEDIDMKELEDSIIAMFVGSEQLTDEDGTALTREDKLSLARYRMNEIVDGRAQSVSDRATSAVELSKKALALAVGLSSAAGAVAAVLANIAT